jgi:phage gpG-like protein
MARSGVTGDGFRTLDLWVKKIESVGSAQGLTELSDALAEEALDLVAEGFRKETDPYGKRWASKAISNGKPVLVGRTARLRRGWHRKASSARGFRIGPAVNYARHHQSGTGLYGPRKQPIRPTTKKALAWQVGKTRYIARSVKGAPARKMVPDKGKLPLAWRKALVEAARDYFHDRFGG